MFFLHFDVSVVVLLSARLTGGFLLICLSLAVLALFLHLFLLLLFLRLRGWCSQDCVAFCLQRLDLVFDLVDGPREVFFFRFFLQGRVDLDEIVFNNLNFVCNILPLLISQLALLAHKFWFKGLSPVLLVIVNPLPNFVPEAPSSLDWATYGGKGSSSVLILLQGCLLTLTIDPVDGGLKVLHVIVLKGWFDVVFVVSVFFQTAFQVIGEGLKVVLSLLDVEDRSVLGVEFSFNRQVVLSLVGWNSV